MSAQKDKLVEKFKEYAYCSCDCNDDYDSTKIRLEERDENAKECAIVARDYAKRFIVWCFENDWEYDSGDKDWYTSEGKFEIKTTEELMIKFDEQNEK